MDFFRSALSKVVKTKPSNKTNCDRAIIPKPSNVDHNYKTNCDRAIILDSAGHLKDAMLNATIALKLKPDKSYAWAIRGQIYRELEHFDEAVRDLELALLLDPDNIIALRNLG